MGFVTNTQIGSFPHDGSYVSDSPAPSVSPKGANTSVLGISGAANWGKPGTALAFSVPDQDGYQALGDGTTLPNSLMSEAIDAYGAGCSLFVGVRVTDGTDTAATSEILDTTSAELVLFTYLCTGSLANRATRSLSLQSGTATAKPVYSLTFTFPYQNPVTYNNIVAYASASAPAFDAPTFKANVLAAVNGTAPNSVPNGQVMASAGTGTAAPVTGTATASGGTDGATTVTTAVLLGTDGTTAATRTGLYALRGACQGGQVMLAACYDLSVATTLEAFCQSERCIAGLAVGPAGTDTAEAIALETAATAQYEHVVLAMDWDYILDVVTRTQRLVSPIGSIVGLIASLPAYVDPENQYAQSILGILATERTIEGPLSDAERGQRQLYGLQYATNPLDGGTAWGLNHGLTSSGANISDVRMDNLIGLLVRQIGGKYVGKNQTALASDKQRSGYRKDLKTALQGLLSTGQIAAYNVVADLTNNTPTAISQGLLTSNDYVTTNSNIKIVLGNIQVGTTVNSTPASTAA
jgi:hypothetical protein